MNQTVNIVNQPLTDLRQLFVNQGFDLRLVGGCVRDTLLGLTPKDIDLHTDADPSEQISIYQAAGIRYIETGLQHGTVTVVLNDVPYEITSLRQDAETDGRHANVVYTRDGGVLDPDLLKKFEALGYNADEEYDVAELTRIFQHINQSS